MSNRRKLILAILLVFTVALAALSIYITTRPQAPDDTSAAATRLEGPNCYALGEDGPVGYCVANKGQYIEIHRCYTNITSLDPCVVGDPQVIRYEDVGRPIEINVADEATAVCGRVQVDVFPGVNPDDASQPGSFGIAAAPSSCLPATCPTNIDNLMPIIRIPLKTAAGESERTAFYKGDTADHQIPFNEVDGNKNIQGFVCRNCTEADYSKQKSELIAENKIYKGRIQVIVEGVTPSSQIYNNHNDFVPVTKQAVGENGRVRVRILKDNNNDSCKGTNIRLVERATNIACNGACVRNNPSDTQGNCATGYTCSNSGANNGKCILNACAANPALCTDDPTQCTVDEEEPEPLVCGDSCTAGDDCGTGNQCSAGKCVKNTCAENPALCETNMCDLKTNLTCGSACSTDAQCGSGLQCSAGSCKLITCINNPAACSDTNGCNLVPLPTCGDATCNSNELCERTSVNGTTYRACLEGDEGDAPSGEEVPNCTFTGANACQQVPPEPEVPSCGETCGPNGLCPNNHTCNNNNVCVLNTCLTEGACSDNTCTPTTPTTPICGGACANDTQCPTNHSCNNGKCVLNGCTASTCTNGCTVIPETGILDDARFLLVGMALVTLGYLTYKYRIGRSLSLGLIDSEALFVEKLEQSVEKKMKRRNK